MKRLMMVVWSLAACVFQPASSDEGKRVAARTGPPVVARKDSAAVVTSVPKADVWMPTMVPNPNIDYKILVMTPDPNINYTIRVVAPRRPVVPAFRDSLPALPLHPKKLR